MVARMRALRRLVVVAFPLLVAAEPSAQDKPVAVGKLGASVELGKGWRSDKREGRERFEGSEPTRLFRRAREMWIEVTELRTLVENQGDLGRLLDSYGYCGDGQPFEFVREANWMRATRDAVPPKGDWAIRFEILAKDGLAYHLLGYANPRDADFLHQEVEDFREGFEFPNAGSAWQKELAPEEHVVAAGAFELTFTARPFVLTKGQLVSGELYRLQSVDRKHEHVLSVFEAGRISSTQQALDEEARRLRAWSESFTERRRSESGVGDELRGFLCGEAGERVLATMVVPLGERRWMFFRYWCPGVADDPRPERDALFASVKRRPAEGALSLPPLAGAAPERPADAVARLCATLPEVIAFECGWPDHAERDGDGWLVRGWDSVLRVTAKGVETLFAQRGGSWFALRWRGDLLVGSGGDVRKIDGGARAGQQLFTASCACVVQDDLLLVRTQDTALTEVGMGTAPEALVRRSPSGIEATLLRLPHTGADRIAVARDHSRALVGGSDHAPSFAPGGNATWLVVADLERRETSTLGEWSSVAFAVAAGEHWLVTGTPRGEPSGIWLVRSSGEREALLTGGNAIGLEIDGENLVLLQRVGNRCVLRELPLARCRTEARFCQPFTADHLAEIGARLVAELGPGAAPRSASQLAAARQRASAIAKVMCGAELPSSSADVDALVGSVAYGGVAPRARLVLGLLVASTWVDLGAEWVESAVDWTDWQVAGVPGEGSVMTMLVDPRNMVTAAIEGEHDSFRRAQPARDGRAVLIGLDHDALLERAAAIVPADLAAAIANGDTTRLTAILDAWPANPQLRRAVYGGLASAGKLREVEALAMPRAAVVQPAADDLVAWLTAKSQRMEDAAGAREVFDEAMRAVQQHPREARLYLVLGRAAARAFREQPLKARQCFDRVLALQGWGDAADRARAELQALDRK